MRKVFTVAWREFRHTAMTKAFLFGAIIMPILIMALFFIVGPLLMASSSKPLTGTIAIIAPSDVFGLFEEQLVEKISPIEKRLAQPPVPMRNGSVAIALMTPSVEVEVEVFAGDPSEIDALKRQVREGDLAALIIVPDVIVQNPDTEEKEEVNAEEELNTDEEPDTKEAHKAGEKLEVFIHSNFSPKHTEKLKEAISKSIVNARLSRLGHDPSAIRDLFTDPKVHAIRLSDDGGEAADNEIARKLLPLAFMMLLWMATFTSGQYLLTTTIEEKGNKVMEVLLSAISPMQLLAGKILGQAGVSAVILGMYGSTIVAGLIYASLLDLIPISHLVLLGVFFVMAYFMIATIMASVGSAVSELSDAQSLLGPIMLILLAPLILWPVISEDPNGAIATITSYIPPLIPFVMILRVTASTEPVATWQIILSIGVGCGSVVAMVWMCARIFRIGILMQGKPPSFLQLIRWIKQG